MNWPSAVDYRDALQHPGRVFALPELQRGRVETNHLGVPRPRSGASAQVYKLSDDSTTIAVRVFLYPSDERETRYRAIHDHLATVRARSLVNFCYHPQGIRLDGGQFPVLTMDWVEGVSLGEWVRLKVAQKDTAALRRIADRWVEMVQELRSARIAHGDLQHDNVMVVGETLKLVDYDGMCVPRLTGLEALESGKPAYQHPRRAEQRLSLDLDDFSAWIILIALRSVAAQAGLWQEYVEKSENENLLFVEQDLREPARSSLWRNLMASPDGEVRTWAARLRATLPDGPFDSIPPFEIDCFAELRKVCSRPVRDWRLIARLGQGIPRPESLPPDLASVVAEARRRDDARRSLEAALPTGDLEQIAQAYRPALLDDWADCAGLVLRARQAEDELRALEQVRQALASAGDGRDVFRVWARHAARLTGVAAAVPLRDEVERWRRRLEAHDRFLHLLHEANECTIARAWRRLEQVGGHPDAEKYRARAALAQARCERLAKLQAIPASLPVDRQDDLLIALWDEALLGECAEANQWRQRYETARQRRQAWQAVESAVHAQDIDLVAKLIANPLLEGYPPLREQQARFRQLLDAGPRVRRIVERLQRGDPLTFDSAEDRACLRENHALFASRRERIAAPEHVWSISTALLVAGRPPLELTDRGLRIRWTWRALPELSHFLLAVEGRFLRTPAESRQVVRVDIADYRRGVGGFLVPVPQRGGEVRVTVWPVLDLGWIELAGAPLHLGPIRVPEPNPATP